MASTGGERSQDQASFFRLIRRQAPVFIGSTLLIFLVIAGAAGLVNYLRERQIDDAEVSARNLSYLVSEHADRSLAAVNSAVSKVVLRLQSEKASSAASFETLANSPQIQALISDRSLESSLLETLFVVGADGKLDAHARTSSVDPSYISNSNYMKRLRGLGPGELFVSTPFQTESAKSWMVTVSQRVSAPDGAFLGGVSAFVKLSNFNDLFEKVSLGSHGSISLFQANGELLSWTPQSETPLGRNLKATPIGTELVANQADGAMVLFSEEDRVSRIYAVANSRLFPIVSVVATGMDDVMAPWRRQALVVLGGAGAVALAILLGALKLAVRVDQASYLRERAAVDAQLSEEHKRFHAAMDNIVQGVALFDKDGRLVACNRRYADILGLPPSLTKRGAEFKTIRAHRPGQGTPLGHPRVEPDGSILSYTELSDGRIIKQRKKMLGDGGWVSTHEDITAQRHAERRVQEMATSDSLTELSNRFEFKQRLAQWATEARANRIKFAVFYMDLDRFKVVNDTLGHPVGDQLLKQVAQRIRAVVREIDMVARLGGDEFAILQRVIVTTPEAKRLAARLQAVVSEPYHVEGHHLSVGVSIGIAVAPDDSLDSDDLIRSADLALYHAKASGRGQYAFFKPEMDHAVQSRRRMEADLRLAIENSEFELYFQPLVSADDREIKSFEALLRWKHSERGFVSPADFIPVAEETGLILPLGDWVMREALQEAAKWPAEYKVGINVSAVQFQSPQLVATLRAAIANAGIDGARVIVEVTESVVMMNAEQALATFGALKEMGVTIAMDDFGTGYSSLSYLNKFPFDKVKVDKSFVNALGEGDAAAAAIVRAAASIAKALNMTCVAEGIETEEQMARVREEGCTEIQGYLISRPMPGKDVAGFLATYVSGRREAPRQGPTRPSLTVVSLPSLARSA